MTITVQEENEVTEDKLVSFSDDGFNVPGWVTVTVGTQSQDVHLDELHHALLGLYSKYRNQLDKEDKQ